MVAVKEIKRKKQLNKLKLLRLFRIGGGLFIYSIVPILSWIVLSFIKGDPRIENVFSITYPMQFVYVIVVSMFATAANIRANKEQDYNQIYSSAFWGIVFSVCIFLIPTIFVDEYIVFFGQDAEFYRKYVIYCFLLNIIQTIFSFVIEKMFFEDKDKKANLHLLAFNLANLALLVISSLIFSDFVISMIVTLAVLFVYIVVLICFECKKFKIDFSFFKNFRYESANLISNIFMFLIYFFGLKNAFCAGQEYVLALTTVGLCTDAFWDALQAISKIAKIDLSKKRYNYKQELKNSCLFTGIVMLLSCAMTIALSLINGAILSIVLIYLSFQIFDMTTEPFKQIMSTYTQLEFSPRLNTIINFVFKVVRVALSVFIISPFCTEVGQIAQCILLLGSYIILRGVKYKVVEGKLTLKNKDFISNESDNTNENI
ncbi:MAG: hypothetical protein J6A28_02315 [Clostridia bacterium]|nr:hypothetical protein [Clostridia bacterium]